MTEPGRIFRFNTGLQWFADGFARYRRNPVLLFFWVMAYWTILGLLGLLPVAGEIIVAALAPALLLGIMSGCNALDKDGQPAFTLLFAGFGPRLRPLVGLGLLHFICSFLVLLLTAIVDDGVLLQLMARSMLGAPDNAMPTAENLSLAALGLGLFAYLPVMLAFGYAPMLVGWRGFSIGKALFFSLVASWRARVSLLGLLAAITLYGVCLPAVVMTLLIMLGLSEALVTSLVIVPMMTVLAPAVVSSFYTSYVAVLPEPVVCGEEQKT